MNSKKLLIVLCMFFIIIIITLIAFLIVKHMHKEINLTYEINPVVPSNVIFDKEIEGIETIKYNNDYYVFIKMGTKSTGGYKVEIEKIKASGLYATIYVRTIEPKPYDIVTDAFTYPYTVIRFNEKPNVKVIYNK